MVALVTAGDGMLDQTDRFSKLSDSIETIYIAVENLFCTGHVKKVLLFFAIGVWLVGYC